MPRCQVAEICCYSPQVVVDIELGSADDLNYRRGSGWRFNATTDTAVFRLLRDSQEFAVGTGKFTHRLIAVQPCETHHIIVQDTVRLSLVIVYGAYALVDGLFSIYAAIQGGNTAPRWWLAIVGIAGVLAGIISFVAPGVVGLWLLMLIAAWAIVSGVFEIIGAIRLRKEIDNEWMLILHGVISVLFGAVLFANPASGAVAMIWVIGAYAIAAGIIMSVRAFRLKKHAA